MLLCGVKMEYEKIRLEVRNLRKHKGISSPKRTEILFRKFYLNFIESLLNKLEEQDKIISELEKKTEKKPRGRPPK